MAMAGSAERMGRTVDEVGGRRVEERLSRTAPG